MKKMLILAMAVGFLFNGTLFAQVEKEKNATQLDRRTPVNPRNIC